MSKLDLFLIPLDYLNKATPQPICFPTFLNVRLQFKDSGIQETVSFANLSAFQMIEDDVTIKQWKFVQEQGDDVFEIITEGHSLVSLVDFFTHYKKEV